MGGEISITELLDIAAHGVKVASMAAGIDVAVEKSRGEPVGATEELYAACGEAGVPIIRICQGFDSLLSFHENLDQLRAQYDAAARLGEKHGVCLGVQMHYDHTSGSVTNSFDSYLLLKDYDPRYIAAVWDAGHSGLAGEPPRRALECLWDHLCMVNFKAAYWAARQRPRGRKRPMGRPLDHRPQWHVPLGRSGGVPEGEELPGHGVPACGIFR